MEDDKPFDLRDRIALEILNGLISHSRNSLDHADFAQEIMDNIGHSDKGVRDGAAKRIEHRIRSCYKVADIMRKVRLSTFE
jgi:hypothetical protein